jgi:hypothetical protein
MKYLVALFVPPLYFALRKQWGACAFNSMLYLLALATLIVGVGVFFWFVAVAHAMWSLRKELMVEHATIMAKKFAEEMRKPEAQA